MLTSRLPRGSSMAECTPGAADFETGRGALMRRGRLGLVFSAASDSNGRKNPEGGSRGTSIGYPAALQIFRVLPNVFEIHKSDLPTRFQHAHNFRNGLAAPFAARDIVDCKIGHYSVHGGVWER